MKNINRIILVVLCGGFLFTGCQKDPGKTDTIKALYKIYKKGAISECQLNGELVYKTALNTQGPLVVLYDIEGNDFANCSFGCFSVPDDVCSEVDQCEMVYCIPDNVWGLESIDKYNLSFR